MKKIRNSVFETNSSSAHSITISDYYINDTITPDEDGIIYLDGGNFGWEKESYNDALTKANYCAIDSLYDTDKQAMLREAIKDITGCADVIIRASDDYDSRYYSYIDHQSCGTTDEAFYSRENLIAFIFNDSSYLFTDNDNH